MRMLYEINGHKSVESRLSFIEQMYLLANSRNLFDIHFITNHCELYFRVVCAGSGSSCTILFVQQGKISKGILDLAVFFLK